MDEPEVNAFLPVGSGLPLMAEVASAGQAAGDEYYEAMRESARIRNGDRPLAMSSRGEPDDAPFYEAIEKVQPDMVEVADFDVFGMNPLGGSTRNMVKCDPRGEEVLPGNTVGEPPAGAGISALMGAWDPSAVNAGIQLGTRTSTVGSFAVTDSGARGVVGGGARRNPSSMSNQPGAGRGCLRKSTSMRVTPTESNDGWGGSGGVSMKEAFAPVRRGQKGQAQRERKVAFRARPAFGPSIPGKK